MVSIPTARLSCGLTAKTPGCADIPVENIAAKADVRRILFIFNIFFYNNRTCASRRDLTCIRRCMHCRRKFTEKYCFSDNNSVHLETVLKFQDSFHGFISDDSHPDDRIIIDLMNMKHKLMLSAAVLLSAAAFNETEACTGISLMSKDSSYVLARTCEWGGSFLQSRYVAVPRGYTQNALTPTGRNGVEFTAKYGYVGISVMQDEFVTEGLNEAGLSAGLFFFPGYGKYEDYDAEKNASTIVDVQLAAWILGNFSTVDEVIDNIGSIRIVALSADTQTAHWRIGDASGRQVVLEIIGGKPEFHENKLGVLTNSPGFEWQMTNLNNYVNLYPGNAQPNTLAEGVTLSSFGAGTGFRGIPGDVTPPSRFVRIAFYKATAPQYATGFETVKETFQILNNFDIPIGIEHGASAGPLPENVPSATQWTTSSDLQDLKFYYRTAWNSTIRCIDLKKVRFDKIGFVSRPVDKVMEQPVEYIDIR